MEQQQWSEWIEWKGGECPVGGRRDTEVEARCRDGMVIEGRSISDWQHRRPPRATDITAYRLARSDRDTDISDGVDEQERMVERDEPAKAAQPVPADPIAALWQAIGVYSVQVSETGECAPPAELLAAVEAIQQALTPPAPAKPEPKTADFSMLAPMERLGATRWGAQS